MAQSSFKKETLGSRLFTIVNTTLLTLIALVCLLPFINVFASSFASTQEVVEKRFILFPTTFSWTLTAISFQLLRSLKDWPYPSE